MVNTDLTNQLILWQTMTVRNKGKHTLIGVIAKYEWYIEDAKSALSTQQIEVKGFSNLKDLNREIAKGANFKYLFFPHFSEIIPKSLYSNFLCIGFHTGDLPKDRGGSPIQHKIINGKYKTKVSAFKIEKEVDGGPIYLQMNIDLSKGDIYEILLKLSKICSSIMGSIITKNLNPKPQKKLLPKKSRLLAEDSNLANLDMSLRSIYDRIRMVDGLDYPRAYLDIGKYRLEFTEGKYHGEEVVAVCKIRKRRK